MAKQSTLQVGVDGKRRYINVPAHLAQALHLYLRSKNVRSEPPQPAYTGFDNIELTKDANVTDVQALLDAWSKVSTDTAAPAKLAARR